MVYTMSLTEPPGSSIGLPHPEHFSRSTALSTTFPAPNNASRVFMVMHVNGELISRRNQIFNALDSDLL